MPQSPSLEINRQPCGNFRSLGKIVYPWLVDEVEAGEMFCKDDAETWKKNVTQSQMFTCNIKVVAHWLNLYFKKAQVLLRIGEQSLFYIRATLASFTTTQKATDKSGEWRLPCKLVATMANGRRMLEQHRLPPWNNFTASKQQSLANQLGCTYFSLATRGCQRVTDQRDWGFSNWFHRLAGWGFYFFFSPP